MYKESDVEILMADRCTEMEARRFLENGTTIFSAKEFEENFDSYMSDWQIESEDIENYRKMITDKVPATDWGIVEYNNCCYYIEYVM